MCKLVTVGYAASDTYLHLAPLFHIGGISSALAVLLAGGAHVFLPRWEGPLVGCDANQ
jgi:acyl-activating enzyme 14